jgi:hypothetical protein
LSEIRNRVAESSLITIDMKSFVGLQKREHIDISQWLHNGMVLKEKIFRDYLNKVDWSQYKSKYVAIYCSVDTIIPIWSYMLVTKYLTQYTRDIVFGDKKDLEKKIFEINISELQLNQYQDKRILVKGCADTYIPEESYIQISNKLIGTVKSLMFGEACSNVPIYRSS